MMEESMYRTLFLDILNAVHSNALEIPVAVEMLWVIQDQHRLPQKEKKKRVVEMTIGEKKRILDLDETEAILQFMEDTETVWGTVGMPPSDPKYLKRHGELYTLKMIHLQAKRNIDGRNKDKTMASSHEENDV